MAASSLEGAPSSSAVPGSALKYPNNLLYAQSMLTISTAQLQRVELLKVQLQLQLMQLDKASSWGAASSAAGAAGAAERFTEAATQTEVPGDAAAAVAAEAPPAVDVNVGLALDQFRAYRARLISAVTAAWVLLMFDLSYIWFVGYFCVAIVYVIGLFEAPIAWAQQLATLLQSHPLMNRVPLEAQLGRLRERQRQAREAAARAAAEPEAAPADGAEAPEQEPAADAAPGAVATGSEGAAVPSERVQEGTEPDAARPAGAEVVEDEPPYWNRFFYQLVVMFLGTLMPWWNPDPRFMS